MFDFLYIEQPVNQANALPKEIVHECVVEPIDNQTWNLPLNIFANQHLANMSDAELDKDWKLNDFFGTVAIINLPNASQRLDSITHELRSIGTDVFEVFSGIDGRKELDSSLWLKMNSNREKINHNTPEGQNTFDSLRQGETGCYMSHYKLIAFLKDSFDCARQALSAALLSGDTERVQQAEEEVRKYSRVLILEDDCGFGIVDKNSVSTQGVGKIFRLAMQELPDNWDMLYLMVHVVDASEETSQHLRKIGRSWFASAYAINYTIYDALVECLKKIEDPTVSKVFPVDRAISEIHHAHHVYAIFPSISFQYPGQSQISGKQRDFLQHQPIKPIK